MLGSRRPGTRVTCIACGTDVGVDEAREYDKHGDRWTRSGKEFEYLCKGCHRELTHQPRDGLETLLDEAGAGERDTDEFLHRYANLIAGESG